MVDYCEFFSRPEIFVYARNHIDRAAQGRSTRQTSLVVVQTAKRFKSDIHVTLGDNQANAKSILNVLSLGANQGSVITIRANGEDTDQALNNLRDLVESNFGGVE